MTIPPCFRKQGILAVLRTGKEVIQFLRKYSDFPSLLSPLLLLVVAPFPLLLHDRFQRVLTKE
jgi:hypothetical protein